MGIVINSKKYENIASNGKKTQGVAYNGKIIYKIEAPHPVDLINFTRNLITFKPSDLGYIEPFDVTASGYWEINKY